MYWVKAVPAYQPPPHLDIKCDIVVEGIQQASKHKILT